MQQELRIREVSPFLVLEYYPQSLLIVDSYRNRNRCGVRWCVQYDNTVVGEKRGECLLRLPLSVQGLLNRDISVVLLSTHNVPPRPTIFRIQCSLAPYCTYVPTVSHVTHPTSKIKHLLSRCSLETDHRVRICSGNWVLNY